MLYPSLACIWTVGDTRPVIPGTLPIDLTDHTLFLDVVRPDGSLLTVAGVIDDEYDADLGYGSFHFAFDVGDLQAGLSQLCTVRDVDADGNPLTSQIFMINVKAKLVATA